MPHHSSKSPSDDGFEFTNNHAASWLSNAPAGGREGNVEVYLLIGLAAYLMRITLVERGDMCSLTGEDWKTSLV